MWFIVCPSATPAACISRLKAIPIGQQTTTCTPLMTSMRYISVNNTCIVRYHETSAAVSPLVTSCTLLRFSSRPRISGWPFSYGMLASFPGSPCSRAYQYSCMMSMVDMLLAHTGVRSSELMSMASTHTQLKSSFPAAMNQTGIVDTHESDMAPDGQNVKGISCFVVCWYLASLLTILLTLTPRRY